MAANHLRGTKRLPAARLHFAAASMRLAFITAADAGVHSKAISAFDASALLWIEHDIEGRANYGAARIATQP
jgi:hypothetical protein